MYQILFNELQHEGRLLKAVGRVTRLLAMSRLRYIYDTDKEETAEI